MFYAARAALLHVGQAERAMGRTHSGLIAAFNQYLVHPGLIGAEYGRTFSLEFNRRLTADYDIDGVDSSDAEAAIASAGRFVAAITELVAPMHDGNL